MSKKLLAQVLVFASVMCSVFASQKIYDYDDVEYRMVKYILQSENMIGPHDTTPISGDALLQSLTRVNRDLLPLRVRNVYDNLVQEFESPSGLYNSPTMMFDFDLPISPEVYFKYGDDAQRVDWYRGYSDRSAIFSLDFEFAWSEYVYGILELPYKLKQYDAQYNETFANNIYYSESGKDPSQGRMPFNAGISLGNSFMNFFLGRGQLNMGGGFTGNMFVADNFQYQDFAKLSFYDNFFSYDLTYTHFDQETDYGENDVSSMEEAMSLDGYHQSRITHSYTFNFADRVAFSFREGVVLQTETALDLRMFNPFIFLHNWKGFTSEAGYWANNIMALDFTVALGAGVRMNFQFVIDQFKLPTETNSDPNALGALLNVSHVARTPKGFLETYFEVVYTSRYLYLNYIDKWVHQDFILGYYIDNGGDISYTGYKYGPNTIAVAFGENFLTYDGKLDLSLTLMYRVHGEGGIKYYDGQNQNPKAIKGSETNWATDLALGGTLEHTLLANVGVSYKLAKSFYISTDLTYQYKINYNNESGNWNNLQVSVGFTFNPLALVK